MFRSWHIEQKATFNPRKSRDKVETGLIDLRRSHGPETKGRGKYDFSTFMHVMLDYCGGRFIKLFQISLDKKFIRNNVFIFDWRH